MVSSERRYYNALLWNHFFFYELFEIAPESNRFCGFFADSGSVRPRVVNFYEVSDNSDEPEDSFDHIIDYDKCKVERQKFDNYQEFCRWISIEIDDDDFIVDEGGLLLYSNLKCNMWILK